jgi:hypothetical protein
MISVAHKQEIKIQNGYSTKPQSASNNEKYEKYWCCSNLANKEHYRPVT